MRITIFLALSLISSRSFALAPPPDTKWSSKSAPTKQPSPSCGHVFLLNCGCTAEEGIAADGILVNRGGTSKEPICKLAEKQRKTSKVRLYEAGFPSDTNNLPSLFDSFLSQSAAHFQGKWSSFRRGKPLLALDPTSFFGPDIEDGEKMTVMKDLMSKLYSVADDFGVDVAVCVPEEEAYISMQKLRDEICPFKGGPFWMLSEELRAGASDLAETAKCGRLSVFVGAGISIPSGGPSWNGLLDMLADKAKYSEEDKESLEELDMLDRPTIMAEDMGDSFKPAIAEILKDTSRFTPAHVLLSSLKLPAVTTNYDELYEKAAASSNVHVPLIPWGSRDMIEDGHSEKNSLLKLHGCVNHPDSIILSRSDYMRYPSTSQALRGRLHGMFLTTEVLFCGFSMTDDNVHQIIDDVRKVLYVNGLPTGDKFGTILTMTHNKMFNRLWDQDFDIHSFGKSWDDNPAWYHDCFIDYIVFLATQDSILD